MIFIHVTSETRTYRIFCDNKLEGWLLDLWQHNSFTKLILTSFDDDVEIQITSADTYNGYT